MDENHANAGWRVKCPRGHARVRRLRDGRYYCRSCDVHYDRSDLRG